MKRRITLLVVALLLVGTSAFAVNYYMHGVYQGYEIVKVYWGNQALPDNYGPAVLINGQVMVPAQSLAQVAGKKLEWNDEKRSLTFKNTYISGNSGSTTTTGSGSSSSGSTPIPGKFQKWEGAAPLEVLPFSIKVHNENLQYALVGIEELNALTEKFNEIVKAEHYGWNRTTLIDEISEKLKIWEENIDYLQASHREHEDYMEDYIREHSRSYQVRNNLEYLDDWDDGLDELEDAWVKKQDAFQSLLEWRQEQDNDAYEDFLKADKKANKYLRDSQKYLERYQWKIESIIEDQLDRLP
ncbi:stalk domain-containing protein [Rubeoparvulum massiliense]|uniref:stalk domain-containing protein n=1 Tax=Rubeoparvulum massiliense TaxID=1631346 RepID=UPI00065DE1B6|nr:hypothetical protein [Rubeoparvulum massiliense]